MTERLMETIRRLLVVAQEPEFDQIIQVSEPDHMTNASECELLMRDGTTLTLTLLNPEA